MINPLASRQMIMSRVKVGAKLRATPSHWLLAGFIALLMLIFGSFLYKEVNLKYKEVARPVDIQLDILPFDDPQTFILSSARFAQLEINLQSVPGGQWEVSIAETEQGTLNHWLEYLSNHGIKVQSLHALNLAEKGKVTVPLLRLMTEVP